MVLLKLGIFDSGIGGLTVYRAIRDGIHGVPIHYLGDTARVPYGTKSAETVVRYSRQIASHLVDSGADTIVVACNTATAYALEPLRDFLTVPVFGVIEPGARAAVRTTRNGIVGVIGTRGTVLSGAYQQAISALDKSVKITAVSCPLFVPLVEEGWLDEEVTYRIAGRYLKPLLEKDVDTLVLGCTHYPLLKEVISRVMGKGVTLIDSARETALDVSSHTAQSPPTPVKKNQPDHFEVTDSPSRFTEVGKIFLGRELQDVSLVALEH
ncbi:MAG: glutamate racemase [Deltaproteobacteria bacterium]|nr:glutamate racemase [Deltaproteobacteria bacterium]